MGSGGLFAGRPAEIVCCFLSSLLDPLTIMTPLRSLTAHEANNFRSNAAEYNEREHD